MAYLKKYTGKYTGIYWNLTRKNEWPPCSSNRDVLESIPEGKRTKDFQQRDISELSLPIERALGVMWCVTNDVLGFRIQFSG